MGQELVSKKLQELTLEELIGLYKLLQEAKIFPASCLFYLCKEGKAKKIEEIPLPPVFFTYGAIIQSKDDNFLWYGFSREIEKSFKIKTLIMNILILLLSYFQTLKTKKTKSKLRVSLPGINQAINEIEKIIKKSGRPTQKNPFIYCTFHFVLSWFYKWEGRKLILEALIVVDEKKQDLLNLFHFLKERNISPSESILPILFSEKVKEYFPFLTFPNLYLVYYLDYLIQQKISKEKKKEILKKCVQEFEGSPTFHSQMFLGKIREIISKLESERKKEKRKKEKREKCLMCEEPIQQGNFCKKCRNIRYRARQFYKILNEKKCLEKWAKNKLEDKEKEEIKKELNKKLHDTIKFETYEKYLEDWFRFNTKTQWKFENKVKLNEKEIKLISQKIELKPLSVKF